MSAPQGSPDSLVFECDFEEPPEKIWRALTEPRLLAKWLGPDAGDANGGPGGRDYEIITAEPHRWLRYEWRERDGDGNGDGNCDRSADDPAVREVHSTVTVELIPSAAGGTHLRLTHADFRIIPRARLASAARATPIASARRGQPRIVSFGDQIPWKRAA